MQENVKALKNTEINIAFFLMVEEKKFRYVHVHGDENRMSYLGKKDFACRVHFFFTLTTLLFDLITVDGVHTRLLSLLPVDPFVRCIVYHCTFFLLVKKM